MRIKIIYELFDIIYTNHTHALLMNDIVTLDNRVL